MKVLTLKILAHFRHRLADIDALPQLTLLGILIGCAAGGLIILFRMSIEFPLAYLLSGNSENFEGLSILWRFSLPVVGALVLGIAYHFLHNTKHQVGVGHVLERLHNYQGRMPLINTLVQFAGGAIALISGQSVGREGPAVHLGASTASLMGQWLRLPNNSMRTLVGCGVAAAIAASFNTPVAGVIFAMEVVLMSYSIASFIPIISASVCGALITRAMFGEEIFFSINTHDLHGLWEVPFMMVAGAIVALFAITYMHLQLRFSRLLHYPVLVRFTAAGLLTGTMAIFLPEILGLGYDTISQSIEGQLSIGLLLAIIAAKILATSAGIGLGLPGGLIGPQMVIGACIGGMIGLVGNSVFVDGVSNHGLYVLLGMAAMMGAVLNAPLAALLAVVELTYSPAIIFPSMLIIVVSCLITRQFSRCEGIFVEQLKHSGTQLTLSPLQHILGNIGVRSAMNTSFVYSTANISVTRSKHILASNPLWVVIDREDHFLLLRAADLAIALQHADLSQGPDADFNQEENSIDLLEIPAQRFNLQAVPELANLFEAKQLLDKEADSALFVTPQIQTNNQPKILGIITRDTINNYYM